MREPDYKKKVALKTYSKVLQLRFKTQDDLENFVARYLDGGGEQRIECYTASVTNDGTWNNKNADGYIDSSWTWPEPMLFIDVEGKE